MKKSFLSFALAAASVALISGCASGPELSKYPQREMDRPYTLPKGVATWHIPTFFGVVKDDLSSVTIPPIPVPLFWEVGLADDWNLLIAPLPLGVAHQLLNTETDRLGASILTGFSYGSDGGFRLQPTLELSYRHKFSADTALDVSPSFTPDIPFKGGQSFFWAAGISAGPLFQTSEIFAWGPKAHLQLTHGRTASSSGLFTEVELQDETSFSAGLGAAAVWSFHRQWDVRPSYTFGGLGSSTGLQAHIFVVDFVHFW